MNKISVRKTERHPPPAEAGETVCVISEDELDSITGTGAGAGYNGMIMNDTAGKASIAGAGGGGYNGTVINDTAGQQGIGVRSTY